MTLIAKVISARAQVVEAMAILDNGSEYEKAHASYILKVGKELLDEVVSSSPTHLAIISHRHGVDFFTGISEDDLQRKLEDVFSPEEMLQLSGDSLNDPTIFVEYWGTLE